MLSTIAAMIVTAIAASPTAAADTCGVRWWPEARYRGYGYDHVVHLRNDCGFPVDCDVSTNVNPRTYTVAVAGRSERAVVTWAGSPAQTFNARVTCRVANAPGFGDEGS
jgi:hypothetical protein